MKYNPGDVVRITNIDGNAAYVQHPTECRTIAIGDVLTVVNVVPSLAGQLLEFERGKGGIYAHRVEMVKDNRPIFEHSPETPECKCPTLIHGHHPGCPLEK